MRFLYIFVSLISTALFACNKKQVSAPSHEGCVRVPPSATEYDKSRKLATELNVSVFKVVEAGASVTREVSDKFQETYQTLSDKNTACNMLFQAMTCIETQNPGSELARTLVDKVDGLCPSNTDMGTVGGGGVTGRTARDVKVCWSVFTSPDCIAVVAIDTVELGSGRVVQTIADHTGKTAEKCVDVVNVSPGFSYEIRGHIEFSNCFGSPKDNVIGSNVEVSYKTSRSETFSEEFAAVPNQQIDLFRQANPQSIKDFTFGFLSAQ